MTLVLSNEEIGKPISMGEVIDRLDVTYHDLVNDEEHNRPRSDIYGPSVTIPSIRLLPFFSVCLFAWFAALVPVHADEVAAFYKSKNVDLLVGYAPGGLNDTLSRVVARHLSKKVPGNPNIVVRNMSSAGPIGIANHMYNAADKDGSVIASLDRTGAQLAIRGELNVRFDPMKFVWLGSVASFEQDAYLVLVNSIHPAKTVADLKSGAARALIGSVGAGSTNQVFAMLARDASKLNIETVRGYRGTGPIFLAMQSNEVDGLVTGISTMMTTQSDLWTSGPRQLI